MVGLLKWALGAVVAAAVAVLPGAPAWAQAWPSQRVTIVVPFGADEVRPGFRGALLAPWPNRVVDGRYAFEGREFELPLTEPRRGHALHGLAAWLDFAPVEQYRRAAPKVGRNDPCPCGSGKKFKHCHGRYA